MLDYLYTLEIDWLCGWEKLPSHDHEFLRIIAVYVLADKYDIPGLRKYCKSTYNDYDFSICLNIEGAYLRLLI